MRVLSVRPPVLHLVLHRVVCTVKALIVRLQLPYQGVQQLQLGVAVVSDYLREISESQLQGF